MFDPITFDGPLFARADMTVSHCRRVLEETGMTAEARRLDGCSVTNREMAQVALEILSSMRVCAEAVYFRAIAMQCVQDSINYPILDRLN